MNVRRKLIAFGAGLLVAGLVFGAGGSPTANPSSVGAPGPAQMPTTTTTGY